MIRKIFLFGLILAGHYGLFLWLDAATRYRVSDIQWQTRTEVTFVAPPVPQAAEISRSRVVKEKAAVGQTRLHESIPAKEAVRAHAPATEKSELRILDSDGRVWIPQSAKDEFLTHGQTRQFDIQRSGLDDMDALIKRPVVLDYRSTRFDADWQGDKPRLTRILETAVEKTTATVKIPIPGRPGAHLQCKLMVLAASGGCGFTANDDGYFVAHDDPATLSPEEEKQCRAWWDLIVSAKTQAEWRRTRILYEQECHKPQAKP
ncbi:hypothetical protein [Arenimonas sp. GDDSR-1]|uniref:hypothetical protein n=1 Tax=Arenimonas sp. GDDSR-1 TaxID=2950125 RepID=UPI00260925C4|nr:hypothetical protein [Arenimonas sp. GDDSR-1]